MNYKINLSIIIALFALQISIAQTDTLISYNISTSQMHIYDQIEIDTTKIFDNTEWNYGSEPGFELLDLDPPDSTFPGAGFTDYFPAQYFFQVRNYPVRTTVKIYFIINDSLKQDCSGTLVLKNYVLTACHCISQYDSNGVFQFRDSIVVFPAFDNGKENESFGSSIAEKYFTFKSNFLKFWKKDIALIRLKQDIGTKTGWIGIAFSNENSYFENRVFHKFSYPGTVDPHDSSRIFNGDTLYYNYGRLDLIEDKWLGYNIVGIPGQSGSSLFYTNNEEYYSFGVLAFSNNSRHLRITPEIFYSFKSILINDPSDVTNNKSINDSYFLSDAYPNPFNPVTKINYTIPTTDFVKLEVYDMLGRVVRILVNKIQVKGKYEVTFNGGDLSSGIYFYRMQAGDFSLIKKLVLLK